MMKKLLFFVLTFTLSFSTIFAQDAEQAYKNAKKAFGLAATAESDKRAEKLEEAREQIDIATAGIDKFDEKTAPKVLLKSGEIHLDLAKTDFTMINLQGAGYQAKYPNASFKAYEAYSAAMELPNLKKYNKNEAMDGLKTVSTFLSNDGRFAFNDKDYKKSYESFSAVTNIDNILIANNQSSLFESPEKKQEHKYVTGLSAYAAEMQTEAKEIFEELNKEGYQSEGVYDSLFKIYASEGKDAEAIAILEKGREIYPEDDMLRVSEINYYLKAGKLDVLTGKLEAAIKADPQNVTLYSTLGHVYDNLSQNEAKEGNADESQKYFDLALEYYNKALEIDGTHFNTIYNTGALYYNKAAQVTRELIEIEEDYSAEGLRKAEAKKSEMMALFDKALPYFQKAEAVSPNDLGTLSALQEIYARKDNLEMTKEFKSRMEIVKSGGTVESAYFN
jgi:tetratricopeptide (TPR) repeat protein